MRAVIERHHGSLVSVGNPTGTLEELFLATIKEAAVLAERSGVFDSVWFGDSLIYKPRVESIVMLSAAAARSRRL